jgi:hypothetical protein
MKKALLILLAFALVFGLVFAACSNGTTGGGRQPTDNGDEGEDGEMKWVVVFNMQDSDAGTVKHEIQKLPEGKVTIGNDLPKGTDSAIKPLVEAGEGDNHVIITAVKKDGKIALQYEAKANWGAGIDLRYLAFGFREGDKITITGEVLDIGATGSYIQPNFKVGNEDGHGHKETAAGEFKWEIELTAAMVSEIKGGDPQAIRIDGRCGSSGNQVPIGQKVLLTQIVIEGNRPTTITKLTAPTIALAGSTVSWTAIEDSSGYEVYSGTELKTTITGTSINILTADEFEYDKKHTITVVAVGTAGSTSNSDASNAVEYTKPAKEIIGFNVKVGAATKKVEVDTVKGTIELLPADKGYEFTYLLEGSNLGYGNAYATFAVDLGAGKTLSDFSEVKVKFKGIEGDIGWKHVWLFASDDAFTAAVATDNAIGDYNANAANTAETPITYDLTSADLSGITEQTVNFIIMLWGDNKSGTTATKYQIYDVELVAE